MNFDRFLDDLWLLLDQFGGDASAEEPRGPGTPCPRLPTGDASLVQRLEDGAADCLVEVTFVVVLKGEYEDPPLCLDGE